MDLSSLAAGNGDLIQQIALLAWVNGGDSSALQKVLSARIGYEIWQRVSGEREVDALRNQTIMAIAKYVKEHPKASKEELQKVISKHIIAFAKQVEEM